MTSMVDTVENRGGTIPVVKPLVCLNFNRLLLRLSKRITADEMNKIKGMGIFSDVTDMTKDEVTTPIQLFNHLRDMQRLSRDNVDVLKEILFQLKRKDLMKEMTSWCRTDQCKVYPLECQEEPEPGCCKVTFNLRHQSVDRATIELLRTRVSSLVFVPVSYVTVSDVTFSPAAITLSVPTIGEELLIEATKDVQQRASLRSIGVETMDLADEHTDLKDTKLVLPMYTLESHLIASLKIELEETKKAVKKLENELIDAHSQEVEFLEMKDAQKRLEAVHENAGMSITLWKMTGKLDKAENRPKNKPKKTQEDIQFESLCQRITRVYPQIKEPNGWPIGVPPLPRRLRRRSPSLVHHSRSPARRTRSKVQCV